MFTPGMAFNLVGHPQPTTERYVASSFQFILSDWEPELVAALVMRCGARGMELKWFGAVDPVGFTNRYDHGRYAGPQPLPKTDRVLAEFIDMRLPLTFSLQDVALIAHIVRAEVLAVGQGEVERVTLGKMGD